MPFECLCIGTHVALAVRLDVIVCVPFNVCVLMSVRVCSPELCISAYVCVSTEVEDLSLSLSLCTGGLFYFFPSC